MYQIATERFRSTNKLLINAIASFIHTYQRDQSTKNSHSMAARRLFPFHCDDFRPSWAIIFIENTKLFRPSETYPSLAFK